MKKNKFLVVLLAFVFASFSLFGCGGNNGNKTPSAVNPATDVTAHKVEGTLHEVNVDDSTSVGALHSGETTEYKIVAPESYGVAAKFLSKHLSAATGATFDVVVADSVNLSGGKYIAFGTTDTITSAISVPSSDELGNQGYYIKTVGDDVLVYFDGENGAQLAAIALLRALVGYDMFAEDLVVYEKSGDIVPAMEIKERPDYDYRFNSNKMSDDKIYGMGFSRSGDMLNTGSGKVHNLFDFFTDSDRTEHEKWFSAEPTQAQPCFTAHGDAEEYAALVQRFTDKIVDILKSNKTAANMRISQNDTVNGQNVRRCGCAACNASVAEYGTLAGAMVSFANDVAAKVYEYIDENEPGREFNLVVLAYGEALGAPVQRNAKGDYIYDANGKSIPATRYTFDEEGNKTVVTDENGNEKQVVCERGVAYEFAASAANWIHSFYEEENASEAASVEAWSGVAGDNDRLYIWSYEISYYQYLYPYNNYDIMVENFRYFKQHGGYFIYPEGTWENSNNPGFAKFRDYVNSKAMFDVNVDYNTLVERFFKYYFGDAGDLMLKYFDEVQINLKNKESITGGGVHTYALADSRVWPEGMVARWNALFGEAYSAVEKYADTAPDYYDALVKHIKIESLFPRYVLCTTYASSYNKTQLKEMRRSFVDDFEELGNTTHQEHYLIDAVTSAWDLD